MSDESDYKIIGCVVSAAYFLYLPIGYIVNGYVLSLLWKWFLTTTFGLPELTIASAIGVSIVIGYLTHNMVTQTVPKGEKEKAVVAATNLMVVVLRPLMALGAGYIVRLFM